MIWPKAEVLPDVTMQILARRLDALGVPQRTQEIRPGDLDERLAAAVMNSWTPGLQVSRLGDEPLVQDPELIRILHAAYVAEPAEAV